MAMSEQGASRLAAATAAALAAVEANWPAQVAQLQALVREPSVLGREAGVQRLMHGGMRELGLQTQQVAIDVGALAQLPGFSPPEWGYRERPNIVGVRRGAGGGRSLVLQGHVDVVSPEPLGHWTRDPWGAEIVGERLYGRGACDMKAGVGAMLFAARAIQHAGIQLQGDLTLQSVIEEECTGNGALACLAAGFGAEGCLIPEPFYRQALVAQVGVIWLRVVVRGQAAHVKGANAAVNAIEKGYLVIQALRALEAQLNARGHPAFADHPWPINLNPGIIRAGDWASTVPAECELTLRLGFFPDTTARATMARVRAHLAEALGDDPWLAANPPELTFFGFQAEGYAVDPATHPVIGELQATHQALIGAPLTPLASTATTDARFFEKHYGIPATCYGPQGANIHGIDEYVELPSVLEVTRVITAFVLRWCGVA
jgi:acetylornithine deacetylase